MGAYYSEAQNKATQRYQQKAYDRLAIRVYKGQADIIKAYAEAQGMSLNGYINKLIADDMGEALTTPQTAEKQLLQQGFFYPCFFSFSKFSIRF